MALSASQIIIAANQKGLEVNTVIPHEFQEIEYLAVKLKFGVTAFFIMNNETFDYSYSHTYNALNDKTTKRCPKAFKLA